MPNGGSDCCGTCWFNKQNRGEAGIRHNDQNVKPYCEIREVPIEDPFYTYCANHPHRRPNRDRIPIGPITQGDSTTRRWFWRSSPDSEEIRLHLLDLLDEFFTHISRDRYPIGRGLGEVIIWQLGEFQEKRAERHIKWISENCPDPWKSEADTALARIQGEDT